jgi:hypothetical protein
LIACPDDSRPQMMHRQTILNHRYDFNCGPPAAFWNAMQKSAV